MGGNAKTGIFLSPKCVKRFLATVRSFWSWAFRLSSSSRARLVWRTPTVTLQRKTNLFPSNATTYLMFWRFLWMLNDWSWGFRIAQMHLDWIRFACFRSFNFFRGADICKYFCNFLHALGQWCFIWFYLVRLPISSLLQMSFFQNYPSLSPRSLSLNNECNLLKALLDNCNVSRVKLFPTSFVGQTHQEQRFPVILR